MSHTEELTREDVEYMEEHDLRLVLVETWEPAANAPIQMWPRVTSCCPYRGQRPCVIAPKPTDGDPCLCPHAAAGGGHFMFCSYKLPTEEVPEEQKKTYQGIPLWPRRVAN